MKMNKKIDRRAFLQTTAAGLAGAVVVPAFADKQIETNSAEKPQAKAKFIYRTLGKTGIKLPVISMGVMNSDNPALVKAALDAGIIHLDTAHVYQRGKNEEMVGEMIKSYPRDSLIIATKIPGSIPLPYDSGKFPQDEVSMSGYEENFFKRLDISLKRLGLQSVDILYLHSVWTKEAVMFEPLMKTLERAKKSGKTRFIGFSTHRNEVEVLQAAIDAKIYDVVLTAYNFMQDYHKELRNMIAKAAEAGIGIIAMKTFAGSDYWEEKKNKRINVKAALKWVLQDPHVTTIIPGFTTFDQLQEDISVMADLTLTDKEKKELESIPKVTSLYCQGCAQCLPNCPERLPIPELMRSYMYAYGYRNRDAAQQLLMSLGLPSTLCRDCSVCTVKCAKGFNVAERIKKIARLRDVPVDFV
jgi:uncharacterized protein